MKDYYHLLVDQLKELDDLIRKSDMTIRKYEENKVDYPRYYSSKDKGIDQFYKKEDKKRVYVRVSERETVKKALQKEYDYKVNEKLHEMRKRLLSFLKGYNVSEINKIYESMGEVKKKLVKPIVCSDEEFVANWLREHKSDENYMVDGRIYKTEAGEMVRSKSEKILADLFYKNGIPYVYEMNLKLRDGSICVPDFTLLKIKERKTVYWEHFGIADDPNYAVKTLNKLYKYENNGIVLGRELIISFESARMAFDISQIQAKINKVFFE